MSLHLPAHQIRQALSGYFGGQGHVILHEVRSETGAAAARSADSLILSTWPSRGLHAIGVEIKSSKSDLQRELANPAKADVIARCCSAWYLATSDGMCDGLMIPEPWGILYVDDKLKMRQHKKAAWNKEPAQWSMEFCCSVLRNFSETHIPLESVEERIGSAIKVAKEEARESFARHREDAQKAVEQWKKHTGIDLMSDYGHVVWDIDKYAAAFNILLNATKTSASPLKAVEDSALSLREAAKTVEKCAAALRKAGA